MLSTKFLYLQLIASLLMCCSVVVFGQTASEMKRAQMTKKQTLDQVESNSYKALQREVPLFQLIRRKSSGVVNAEFKEVQRKPLRGIKTDDLDMSKQVSEDYMRDGTDEERAVVPELSSLKGNSTFEFYDITTGRTFQMTASKAEMAEFARSMSRIPNESMPLDRPDPTAVAQDKQMNKAWSNADDSRTRRAIADGYGSTHSIYQRIARYGGCSATVLSANSQRMVASTAAHCIFPTGNNTFSNSVITPRSNGSGFSPTYGWWRVVGFGYYPSFLDDVIEWDCYRRWRFGPCIRDDIAIVVAVPADGAKPPHSMGWSYHPKSWLNARNKYRRGYPGCGLGHSPANCNYPYLYGDGPFSIGSVRTPSPVSGWNRVMLVSTDINPGDSGSGAYYYSSGYPYVFAVTSAEQGCVENCTDTHVNYLRRITPDWFDFINDVVF